MEGYVIARRRNGELVGWTAPRGRNNQGEGAWTPFPEFFHYYATKQRAEAAIERGRRAGNTTMDEAYVVTESAFAKEIGALTEEDLIGAVELVANGEPSGMYGDETEGDGRTWADTYLSELEQEAYGDEILPVLPSYPEPGELLVVRQVEQWMSEYVTYTQRIEADTDNWNMRGYWEDKARVASIKAQAAQQVLGLLDIHVLWPIDD